MDKQNPEGAAVGLQRIVGRALARGGRTVKLKGPGLNDWFAEQLVKEHGPALAREKCCGPALAAVERVIARLPPEAVTLNAGLDRRNLEK